MTEASLERRPPAEQDTLAAAAVRRMRVDRAGGEGRRGLTEARVLQRGEVPLEDPACIGCSA